MKISFAFISFLTASTALRISEVQTPAEKKALATKDFNDKIIAEAAAIEAVRVAKNNVKAKEELEAAAKKTNTDTPSTGNKAKWDTAVGVTATFRATLKEKETLKDAATKARVKAAAAVTAAGDPHVVNMAGEKFDILATGTFSLLSLTRAPREELVINGTIARFGAKCGESFITDLKHTGGWIHEIYNTEALKVRAVQDASQKHALQVNFGQKWEPLSSLQEIAHLNKAADAMQLEFSNVMVKISAGKHWRHGWNFLNLDVQGLANLDDNIRVGGLLGHDDHTHVLQADADCAMFAEAAGTDMQDQQSCLSYMKAS